MHEFHIALGKRISQMREKLNMSQEYLAEMTGLHRNTIGRIERAERGISLETLFKLALVLDTTPGDLIEGLPIKKRKTT